jgi:hypothetical protein
MGLTRSAALRRVGMATAGAVTGSALARISLERAGGAYAAPPLEHYYTTPFRPGVSFAVPESWNVAPDFLPDVREPRHVGISNRPITITKTLDGIPDIRDMPSDAALLVAFVAERTPEQVGEGALSPTPRLRFADLGEGTQDDTPGVGRRYFAWYMDDQTVLSIYLLVGTDPDPGWHAFEGVMNSMQVVT